MQKQWRVLPHDRLRVEQLLRDAKLPAVVAQLLVSRGVYQAETAKQFLDMKLADLREPLDLPGMPAATALLSEAIRTGKSIVIYGDYDCDGMTSTAILYRGMKLLGADVSYYVPNRLEEGYGLSEAALRKLAAHGKEVVVSVDCGIGNVAEAELCRELGMQLVITDHHQLGNQLPAADAIVHPRLPGTNYPFGELCGAGVAFKLAWALCQEICGSKRVTDQLREYLMQALSLAAIGTVADVVPLLDENRILVRHGLRSLKAQPPLGLAEMMKLTKVDQQSELSSEDIAFSLGPRLNAAGRLGQAQLGVELLTTNNPERASALAEYINQLNITLPLAGGSDAVAAGEGWSGTLSRSLDSPSSTLPEGECASQATSFMRPELLAIPEERMAQLMASDALERFRLQLERLLRFRPHTLSDREERLLAMQGEMAGAAGNAFRQLNDADLKFGNVTDHEGRSIELTHASFGQLLISPDRDVRRNAFDTYYEQFAAHENTLAATLSGSIHADVYYARARNFDDSLSAALFPDNVPTDVYDNLISAVRDSLPAVHHYLDVRRRKMQLDKIHHYDTYVPILNQVKKHHTWDQAVEVMMESLRPLGAEYCDVLKHGLEGRWADRYPNRGKQSGAFSCGSYDGNPHILMNFKEEVLNDVFTLTHEAGHSMHSWYSARHQPYEYYNYTIFVAEVASTFNEQLLTDYLIKNAEDDTERAYLINNELDGIRATVVRQTMFAEFEKQTHEMAEAGEPLTVESFRQTYRELLDAYFGPDFAVDEVLELECFRIPHFYRSFYVYKYATGLSAAVALSRRVLDGGEQELRDYLTFLSSGCSKDPLDLLRDAGVDMTKPEPVATTLQHFEKLTSELDALI
jgi:oligoendopeptidase F